MPEPTSSPKTAVADRPAPDPAPERLPGAPAGDPQLTAIADELAAIRRDIAAKGDEIRRQDAQIEDLSRQLAEATRAARQERLERERADEKLERITGSPAWPAIQAARRGQLKARAGARRTRNKLRRRLARKR